MNLGLSPLVEARGVISNFFRVDLFKIVSDLFQVFWLYRLSFWVVSKTIFKLIKDNEIYSCLILEFVQLPEINYSEPRLLLAIDW
mgnify:FL=1